MRGSDPRDRLDRFVQSKPGDETDLGSDGWIARIDQEEACVKVARRRCPCPAMAAPPRTLLARDDPKLTRLAVAGSPERIFVGRPRRVEEKEPVAGGFGLR